MRLNLKSSLPPPAPSVPLPRHQLLQELVLSVPFSLIRLHHSEWAAPRRAGPVFFSFSLVCFAFRSSDGAAFPAAMVMWPTMTQQFSNLYATLKYLRNFERFTIITSSLVPSFFKLFIPLLCLCWKHRLVLLDINVIRMSHSFPVMIISCRSINKSVTGFPVHIWPNLCLNSHQSLWTPRNKIAPRRRRPRQSSSLHKVGWGRRARGTIGGPKDKGDWGKRPWATESDVSAWFNRFPNKLKTDRIGMKNETITEGFSNDL